MPADELDLDKIRLTLFRSITHMLVYRACHPAAVPFDLSCG